MKTNHKNLQRWGLPALLLVTAMIIAACGGQEATPTPIPPAATATTAPTAPADAAESPLAQPESPLLQPESPLTGAPAELATWAKSEEEALALAETTTAPEPKAGFAAIGAVLYSYGIGEVIPGTQFYLTAADEVEGEFVPPAVYFGPRSDEGDVISESTMQGLLQLDSVPAGNYYLLLWTVYNWLPAFPSQESQTPLLITVEEGEKLDLGMLYFNWP